MSEIFVSCSEGIDGERWQALKKRSWEPRSLLAGSSPTCQMEWLTIHSLGLSLLIRANLMSSCQLWELTAV